MSCVTYCFSAGHSTKNAAACCPAADDPARAYASSGGRSLSYTKTRHASRMRAHYYTRTATQRSARYSRGSYAQRRSTEKEQFLNGKSLPYPYPSVWYGAAHRLIRMPDCYVYAGSLDEQFSMCAAAFSFQTEGSAARLLVASLRGESASPTTNP
jgi:hypothetical protein